ncbi:glycosyltransferase family 4 protein [Rhodococcus sp. HNM0563]|nr:glycosyltransferase family 4 protein [Rhodococcus sp. HNM0563]
MYFHPARWEGAPITPLEASAIGTPVLARAVDTMTGLGFPSAGATPSEAASAIRRFACDSEYRWRVNQQTSSSTRVHSPEVQRRALDSLYRTAGKQNSCRS